MIQIKREYLNSINNYIVEKLHYHHQPNDLVDKLKIVNTF